MIPAASTHWSKIAEVGSAWGIRFTFAVFKALGERVTRLLLHPVVLWFLVFAPRARRASQEYLRRQFRRGAIDHPPTWRDSYWHFYAFAEAALDKVAAWMGRITSDRMIFERANELYALRDSGCGALIIGSHLGSLETARALASKLGQQRKINAIVHTEHALRFNEILARCNPAVSVNLIHVSRIGPDTAIALAEKIDRGELLFVVGDRTPASENGRVTNVSFLGDPAPFAQGPFILASLLKCPVFLFFCIVDTSTGRRMFRIDFEHFEDRVDLPRKRRAEVLADLTSRYAARLAEFARRTPLQWFNFYDFWQAGTGTRSRDNCRPPKRPSRPPVE